MKKEKNGVISLVMPFISTGVGGAQVSSMLLAKTLKCEFGWDVHIAVPCGSAHSDLTKRNGIQTESYAVRLHYSMEKMAPLLNTFFSKFIFFAFALCYLCKIRPDFVNLHVDAGFLQWACAARCLGIPVIWYVRASQKRRFGDKLRLFMSNCLVFASDATRIRFNGYDLPPHCTIRNGVPPEFFKAFQVLKEYTPPFSLSEGELSVLFVGNLVRRKRPEWAAESALKAMEAGASLKLIFIGTETEDKGVIKRITSMFQQHGKEKQLLFLGYRTDVAEIMRSSDILVLSSEEYGEAFPRVIIEGMAAGMCVVATDVAGVGEAVTNEVDGFLVPHYDHSAMSEVLVRLASNPQLRIRISSQALRTAMRSFQQDKVGYAFQSFVKSCYQK